MRNTILGLAAAVLLMAAPRGARACGYGGGGGGNYGGLITLALVTLSVDAGLTIWDGGSALAGHQPSATYGVVEVLVAAPQLALGLAATSGSGYSSFNWYTVWMGLMTAHGIWTVALAIADDSPQQTRIPAPLSAPEHDKKIISLGPTYVPLGQLARPGVGLVGRF